MDEYLKEKELHPDGCLFKKYGKERLRTMYKNDKQLKIDGELAIKKKETR